MALLHRFGGLTGHIDARYSVVVCILYLVSEQV